MHIPHSARNKDTKSPEKVQWFQYSVLPASVAWFSACLFFASLGSLKDIFLI